MGRRHYATNEIAALTLSGAQIEELEADVHLARVALEHGVEGAAVFTERLVAERYDWRCRAGELREKLQEAEVSRAERMKLGLVETEQEDDG